MGDDIELIAVCNESGLLHAESRTSDIFVQHIEETSQPEYVPWKPSRDEWFILACLVIVNLVVVSNSYPHFNSGLRSGT